MTIAKARAVMTIHGGGDPASDRRKPSFNSPECVVEDLAPIVEPGTFIVDDVALPPPITFLVLPAETAVCGLGLASGGARVSRFSETGSDNDDSEAQSSDERLHDTSPSIVHWRGRVARASISYWPLHAEDRSQLGLISPHVQILKRRLHRATYRRSHRFAEIFAQCSAHIFRALCDRGSSKLGLPLLADLNLQAVFLGSIVKCD